MSRHRIAVSVSALALTLVLGSAPAGAQLFGPSDEEKAHEANQDAELSDLGRQAQQASDRVQRLEDKVQNLTASLARSTGANEELSHQIQLQNDKIDRMQKDFAYRLCTLSAQQLGASPDDQGLNCAAAGSPGATSFAPPPLSSGSFRPGDSLPPIGSDTNGGRFGGSYNAAPPVEDAPQRGRPPGILGTLPATRGPAQLNGSLGGPGDAGGNDPRQFDMAMNLLSKAQYAEATAAFQGYADANPNDTDLTPQAIFWVGNIGFVRQDYVTAQRNFALVVKKYPKSSRAPDAMLKLGQSFLAMGQKPEGCTTLGLIKSRYPDASASTLAAAASIQKTTCR